MIKRLSISLPADSAKMLELLTELQGVTQAEALRRAISTEAYMQREIREGSKVLIQKKDGEIVELFFR